jgi:hypothetical protein
MPNKKKPGRPSIDPETLKQKVTLMLSPAVVAYLETIKSQTGFSKSATTEHCIRIQMRKGTGSDAAKTSCD